MFRTHETVFQRLECFYLIFDSYTLNNFGYFFFRKMEARTFVICIFLFRKDLHPSTQTYRTSRNMTINYGLWQQLETD